MPSSTTDQFAQYKLWLAAGNADIDVYMVDVIWAPQLSDQFLDLTEAAAGGDRPTTSPRSSSRRPWTASWWRCPSSPTRRRSTTARTCSRSTAPTVPTTWEELTATAQKVRTAERAEGKADLWGYVWQGARLRGADLQRARMDQVERRRADHRARRHDLGQQRERGRRRSRWPRAGSGPSRRRACSPTWRRSRRGVWQTGNAVFMRNWPYAYALGNGDDSPIKGKFDVAPLPSGGGDNTSAATLGGWNLAVSSYSPNPEAAIALAMYMASAEFQKQIALKTSHLPTIMSLYDDAGHRRGAAAGPALEGHLPERGAAAVGADQGRLQRGLVEVLDGGARLACRDRNRRGEPRDPRARPRRDEGRRLVAATRGLAGRAGSGRGTAPPADNKGRARGGSDVTTTTVSGLPPRGTGAAARPAKRSELQAERIRAARLFLLPMMVALILRRRLAAAPHDLLQLHRHLAHQPRPAASGSASTTT